MSQAGPDVRFMPEYAKYEKLMELHPDMWQENALLHGLHMINACRVPYFERALAGGYAGKRVLDIGCGGGIFSESLAKKGASVVAFDPSEKSLQAARESARKQNLKIDYRVAFAEDFDAKEQFDAVFAVDVLEHVNDLDATLTMAVRHMKPGALFGYLTHNQTLEAFTFLIWEGEYHTGFIPKGNHDFHKFIRPDDLAARMRKRGLKPTGETGLHFDMTANPPKVVEMADKSISYMGHARRS